MFQAAFHTEIEQTNKQHLAHKIPKKQTGTFRRNRTSSSRLFGPKASPISSQGLPKIPMMAPKIVQKGLSMIIKEMILNTSQNL
jgi:hypothetical protein